MYIYIYVHICVCISALRGPGFGPKLGPEPTGWAGPLQNLSGWAGVVPTFCGPGPGLKKYETHQAWARPYLFTLVLIYTSEPDLSQASDCMLAGNATGCQCHGIEISINTKFTTLTGNINSRIETLVTKTAYYNVF